MATYFVASHQRGVVVVALRFFPDRTGSGAQSCICCVEVSRTPTEMAEFVAFYYLYVGYRYEYRTDTSTVYRYCRLTKNADIIIIIHYFVSRLLCGLV